VDELDALANGTVTFPMMSRKFPSFFSPLANCFKLSQTLMTPFPFSSFSAPPISTMNHFNLMTLSLVLMISSYGALAAPANADS
jgi:hypothetical protein